MNTNHTVRIHRRNHWAGIMIMIAIFAYTLLGAYMFCAHGQETTNVPPVVDTTETPPAVVTAFFQKIKPIEFLLIPLALVIVQAVKKFVPAIPAGVLLWVGPFVGALADWGATHAGLWSGNAGIGLIFGGLATWVHQFDKQTVDIIDRKTGIS